MSNIENFRLFELFCCNLHQNNYNEETIHWLRIPDFIIVACNIDESFESIRLKRERYE